MKKNKLSNDELLALDPIEVYKLRLDDTIKKFPSGFFSIGGIIDYSTCATVLKYLIENILKWSDEEICKNYKFSLLKKYHLSGMVHTQFDNSPFLALDNAYPGKFKPWQLTMCPSDYWNLETAKVATIWLIEDVLNWSDEVLINNFKQDIFKEHGLWGMLNAVFNGSPFLALDNAYPGKFKPWFFLYCPNHYWNEETSREAVVWLIEEELKWSPDDVCKNFKSDTLKQNHLEGMLDVQFKGSPFAALNNAYPGKYKRRGNSIYLA